jgi:hypothetical protein
MPYGSDRPVVDSGYINVPLYDSTGRRRTSSELAKMALAAELNYTNNAGYSDVNYSRNYALFMMEGKPSKIKSQPDFAAMRKQAIRDRLQAKLNQQKKCAGVCV